MVYNTIFRMFAYRIVRRICDSTVYAQWPTMLLITLGVAFAISLQSCSDSSLDAPNQGPVISSDEAPPITGREIRLRVFLQGPYQGDGVMHSDLRSQSALSSDDPYHTPPMLTNVTPPQNAVDWIGLQFRPDLSTILLDTVAFLHTDGNVIGVDGATLRLEYEALPAGTYYVVVYHRNHLPVMSVNLIDFIDVNVLYDFTQSQEVALSVNQSAMIPIVIGTQNTIFAMIAGDVNNDGIVNAVDRNSIKNSRNSSVGYFVTDINLDGVVTVVDSTIVHNNSFRISQLPN